MESTASAVFGEMGLAMNDVNESVRRFRGELDSAISRGRRARSEAHHHCEGFRERTRELGASSGQARAAGRDGLEGTRADAADFRMRTGLPVEDLAVDESGADESAAAPNARTPERDPEPESQEQTPSDGSDLDFSQRRMLR